MCPRRASSSSALRDRPSTIWASGGLEQQVERRHQADGVGRVGQARAQRLGHQLGHPGPGHGDAEAFVRALLGTVEQHEGHPGPQAALAEQHDGVADRAEAAEEALGGTGAGHAQEAVAEGGVGLDGPLDLSGRGVGVAQLLDDAQARELAGAEGLALARPRGG